MNEPCRGHPLKLTSEQKRLIPDFLWHGPEAYGFRGKVWTCPRVAKVLQEEFQLLYSKSQVSRLLKEIGWTPQVPLTRAIQRDEEAIQRWRVERWPEVKERARHERRTLVFTDESGFYLLPGVVKTYAPKGSTPLLKEWQTRDHLSVMAAVTSQGKVYSLVRQESLNGLHTVAFLSHLLYVAGERLLAWISTEAKPLTFWSDSIAVFLVPDAVCASVVGEWCADEAPEEGSCGRSVSVDSGCRRQERCRVEPHPTRLGWIHKALWLTEPFDGRGSM